MSKQEVVSVYFDSSWYSAFTTNNPNIMVVLESSHGYTNTCIVQLDQKSVVDRLNEFKAQYDNNEGNGDGETIHDRFWEWMDAMSPEMTGDDDDDDEKDEINERLDELGVPELRVWTSHEWDDETSEDSEDE